MRPLNLKMSAFGPYAGEIEIPMDKLGKQGLYLITGDTGAGKTTIFDAICYALFGEASGENRDATMLRSKYADSGIKTEVELLFEHSGAEYSIRRNPKYMRPSKRGDGYTEQVADATMYFPDGSVVSSIKEVNHAVKELLGINRQQFSQIAMLSQGEFLKLLLADTRERRLIFRDIFKTSYYLEFQQRLEEDRKSLYEKASDSSERIRLYISEINVADESLYVQDVQDAKNGLKQVVQVLDILKKISEEDTQKEAIFVDKINALENQIKELDESIGRGEEIVKSKEMLSQAKEQLELEESRQQELYDILSSKKEILSEKDELIKRMSQLDGQMKDYEEADKQTRLNEADQQELKRREKSLSDTEYACKKTEKELVSMKKEKEELEGLGISLQQLKNEYQQVSLRLDNLLELQKVYKKYDEISEELTALQENYASEDSRYQEQKHKYDCMDKSYRDGQAGILAKDLVEGQPCPVCGSLSHPALATYSNEIPTKEALEKEKQLTEKMHEKLNSLALETNSKLTQQKSVIESVEELIKKYLGAVDFKQARDQMVDEGNGAFNRRKLLNNQISEIETKLVEGEKLGDKISDYENKIKELQGEVLSETTKISAISERVKLGTAQVKEILERLEFENLSTAKRKREELEKRADNIQKEYDIAAANLSEHENRLATLKGRIVAIQGNIEAAKDIDIEYLKSERKRLCDSREQKQRYIQEIRFRINSNKDIYNNVNEHRVDLAKYEDKLKWIKALADTANGNLSGKDRLVLETYIQATYFDRIIEKANQHFIEMSDGKYELKRMEEADDGRSQYGLALGVIDHYDGCSQRSVKSLSGGESFMASLSLALGLSEEVQASAGGIQIDTMFVDEGFGSLDSETLEQAYRALVSLTDGNRLIGIISHVADLKNKIDNMIMVKKEKSGGSTAKVVV